jgi:hypothetical protein
MKPKLSPIASPNTLSGLAMLAIAFITLSVQTIRAANANP